MAEPLLPRNNNMNDPLKEQMDEIGSCLQWMCLNRSSGGVWNFMSFAVFLVLGLFVPAFSHYHHMHDPDQLAPPLDTNLNIELSLSLLATISFIWISYLLINIYDYNIALVEDTHLVRRKFTAHLYVSLKIRLPCYVLVFFVAKCAYNIWWYSRGASENPFLGNMIVLSNIVACSLELTSWLYRTTIFFFACIIFSDVHYLQKLRVDDFNKFFKAHSDSKRMLKDYLRIFEDMGNFNNYCSPFLALSFVMISMYQVLQSTAKPRSTIFTQTDILLCSLTIASGLKIMLDSAIDMSIVMKGITSAACRWHATQTVNADQSLSFQERQALVNCFAQNPCGVVIFGVKVGVNWLRFINCAMFVPTWGFFFNLF